MKKEIIQIQSLCYSYEDKDDVLQDVSITINEGESVGVIGPNGAGKTTLFLLLCGILKPSRGNIRINGKEVVYKAFNRSVGYVFQNPDDQLFSPSVWDDIAFGPMNMALSKEEITKRVERALEICNCKHLANRPSHHLSGGEKRMVAIASVLSMEPEIMIYDEPSASMDMRSRRNIINLIASNKKTNLIASHDMEFILETCQRVILIDSGKLIRDGQASDIMGDFELMEKCGLEVPYSLINSKYQDSRTA
ncbi:MAG: ABC transporter ATP-binding protein [Calditrichaeota bacterium]|nr:ABC transporter ATP-binding protein [Calditrichota bacterium]